MSGAGTLGRQRAMLRSAQAMTLGSTPRMLFRKSLAPGKPAISAARLVKNGLAMRPSSKQAAKFCNSEALALCTQSSLITHAG